MDDRLQPLKLEIAKLQRRLDAAESRLDQCRGQRDPKVDRELQIRWAETCNPSSGSYPIAGSGATVFPIKFLDAHFTATIGVQSFDSTTRQSAQAAVVYSSQYLAVNTKIPVFWCRGLGDEDAGEWWIW